MQQYINQNINEKIQLSQQKIKNFILIYFMEDSIERCINNNKCVDVCSTSTCIITPFMCSDEKCYCQQMHRECTTNIKWRKFIQKLYNKINKPPIQLSNYVEQVNQLYETIIKQIQKSYAKFKNISQTFGLNQVQKDVLTKLREKRASQLTGYQINLLQSQISQEFVAIQIKNIHDQKKQIRKDLQKLVKIIDGLIKFKPKKPIQSFKTKKPQPELRLLSKITNDVETIKNFFSPQKIFLFFQKQSKKIKEIKLLYRASENKFQADKFWNMCDGKKNTLIIIKTQFNKIIGGFTPLPWKKDKACGIYEKDQQKQSFIFSMTEKIKFRLINGEQDKAIYYDKSHGPTFGYGHDIVIKDKANQNVLSYANFNNSYYNKDYAKDSQEAHQKFSGQSSGDSFMIDEWQVHQIIFA